MISEARIRKAFMRLSSDGVIQELRVSSAEEDLETFLELLVRSNHLFFKYPNGAREKLRNDLFERILIFFQELGNVPLLRKLEVAIAVLTRVELGYRNLLSLLEQLPARGRPPEIQSSAAIQLAANRFDFIGRRAWSTIKKVKNPIIMDELEGVLDDGSRFSIDSATTALLDNLGTTLVMFALENDWIDDNGKIVLPDLSSCTDQEVEESAETEFLAASWRRWERVEQRRRYWGGEFVNVDDGISSSQLPPGAKVYFEYVPTKDDQFDWVANERFKDQLMQGYAALNFETSASEKVSSLGEQPALLPEAFVSLSEINSAALLSMILGVDVRTDPGKYFGLRIVEWLRGYCTLGEIARDKCGFEQSSKEYLIQFKEGELENRLAAAGLSREAAGIFIERVTFHSRSLDFFDCPLLRHRDGSVLLLGPAACYAEAGVITYSNLVSLGETFEKKGRRFEETVLNYFKEKGFAAFSIDTSREGSSYEIDVLVPWEEYLFVFECKNKGLSNNHPIRSYYFRKERDGFVQQIKRQVQGLLKHSDMSIIAGGIDPSRKIIVPCVLYELPYAEPDRHDGVFIADWYSLSRFFNDKYISLKRPHELFRRGNLLHRTAVYSLWSGEKPSPDDLLRHLSDPVQVKIMRSKMIEIESTFAIGNNAYGRTSEYYRKPQNIHELARVLGFDARAAKKVDKHMKRAVASLNNNVERKLLIQQTRAFREKSKRGR